MFKPRLSRRAEETTVEATRRLDGVAQELGQTSGRAENSELDAWVKQRILSGKVKDDFTDEEYDALITIARQASKQNWAHAGGTSTAVVDGLRQSLSLRVGDQQPTWSVRGTFDAIEPDIGSLQASGLTKEARHFARRRYKKSTDGNVNTVRRWWFEFCLTIAFISPIRPQPGVNGDAASREEDIGIHFATFLARTKIGGTVASYISTWKRWHKSVVGYDPISASITSTPMLTQTIAGIRAELPSKHKARYAHPTRLFKLWWAPLGNPTFLGPILELRPTDILKNYSLEQKRTFTGLVRTALQQAGVISFEEFDSLKYTILSALMTMALMRISEAIPDATAEHDPISWRDVEFIYDDDGILTRVDILMTPLKKKRGTPKQTVKVTHTLGKGNVRAAFLLWIWAALNPDAVDQGGLVFQNLPWLPNAGKHFQQEPFRKWYHRRLEVSGVKNFKHFNTHSFRIGGATVLLAAGVSIDQIKAMGRWDSAIAEIYMRPSLEQMVELSRAIDLTDARPFEDMDDAFFDRQAGISEAEADETAAAMAEEAEDEVENLG